MPVDAVGGRARSGAVSARPSRAASTAEVPSATTSALVCAAIRAQSAADEPREQRALVAVFRDARHAAQQQRVVHEQQVGAGARSPRRPCRRPRRRPAGCARPRPAGSPRQQTRRIPALGSRERPELLDGVADGGECVRHGSSLRDGSAGTGGTGLWTAVSCGTPAAARRGRPPTSSVPNSPRASATTTPMLLVPIRLAGRRRPRGRDTPPTAATAARSG